MKNRLLFNINYFFLWVGYFVFARLFFLLFYFERTKEIWFLDFLKTFLYGLQLDNSFAAYLAIIPFFLILFSVFFSSKKIGFLIKAFTFPVLLLINFLLIVDAGLYQTWGIRLDSTLLNYINTPEVMLSSVSTFQLILGTTFWIICSGLFVYLFNKAINKRIRKIEKGTFWEAPIFLLIAAALIIPVRGGLQTIPVNQSNVYFSKNMFANHASINFIWNFFNTVVHKTDGKNPFKKFDSEVAKKIIDKNRNLLIQPSKDSILNTDRPNVIIVIWEGLTAKIVAPLDGEPTVTENLNKLSKEGILFTNFYANGDRTDKGIVSILSGYYPQPDKSIIKMPNKTRNLPILTKNMIDAGYHTTFYYGGDLNFGNMNTYLRNGNVTNFVDGNEFDSKDWNSKWGAHDHVFLERFSKDLSQKQTEPFFKVALTLSSHEPFEFPDDYKFGKDTEEN